MARRRTSSFEDLVTILSRLPWWVSLLVGFVSWLILNPVANSPVVVPAGVKPGDMSGVMLSQLWHTFAMIGRYLVPFTCLMGAIGSVVSRHRRKALLEDVKAATQPGKTIDGDTGLEWKGLLPPKGRHWRYSREVLSELDKNGMIEWSANGNPRKIVLADEHKGFKIQDVWEFKDKGLSYVDYPTQKNENMLERIISNSSNENSVVLDCFCGSGSTLKTADKLNRKWIGIDNSTHSFEVVRRTFQEQGIKCNFSEYISRG